MILEMSTHAIHIDAGVLKATLQVTTDRGCCGMTVAFAMRDCPELDALVPMLDKEIRKACIKSLGLTPQKNSVAVN